MRRQKLYPLDQLAGIISEEKKRGKRIILANGCFDLIHVGHVRYLRESKILGDILILALNSDRSVGFLKGPGRPLMTQKDRAEILCAFSMIDFLIIFDEPNVERILLAIQPHVHAKGSDYTKESVPERKIVESYGGEVAITGGPKVRSTREVIRYIYNRNPLRDETHPWKSS